MALAIPRSQIPEDKVNLLIEHLTLQPIDPYAENLKKRGKFVPDSLERPQISFFTVDEINGEHIVSVPYRFGAGLFQCIPNANNTFAPIDIEFRGTLLVHQEPVAAQALQELLTFGTTTLGVYPGFGKTILGAYLGSHLKLMICVLVTRTILLEQWKKTFLDFTSAKPWIVGEPVPDEANVIICMNCRVHKLPREYRDMIGLLIIDEAHMFCCPSNVSTLLAFHPKYIIAESATLKRQDGMETMIQLMCGTHGIFIESSKPFIVTKLVTGIAPEIKLNKDGSSNYSSLLGSLVANVKRNEMIVNIVMANLSYKILLLTARTKHVTDLHATFKSLGVSTDYMCGDKKKYNDSNVLIGNISKIGVGFDEANSCHDYGGKRIDLCILCASIKNTGTLYQSIGRAFRCEFPNVIHFVDDHGIFKNHWREAAKWYTEHKAIIHEVKMPVN